MARELKGGSTPELLQAVTWPSSREALAEAVGELVFRYRHVVYKHALRVCGRDRAMADDVFQETFVRLFSWLERRPKMPLHSFPSLLRVFAQRTAIDLMRREPRTRIDPLGKAPMEVPEPAAEENVDSLLYAQQILESLDPRSAAVLRLSYLEGMSAIEVAARLGVTPGHVRTLRYRALEAIRARRALDDLADTAEPV